MKSIFFKNFVLTAGMFVLCFLLFGVSLFLMARGYIIEGERTTMQHNAEEVERTASAYYRFGGLQSIDLRMNISSMARSTDKHIFLCSTNGHVVSCSDMEWMCPHINQHIDLAVIEQLQQTGSYESLTTLGGFYDAPHYVVAKTVANRENQLIGYVFISYDSTELIGSWGRLLAIFVVLSVLILVAAVAIEWRASMRNTEPLREMAAAAHSFSKGNFSARVSPHPGLGEISELTDAFNSMAQSLEKNERTRREFISNVSHELRTPMTSIAGFADGILDGVIAPEDERKYLQTISSETKRLSRLVRSMLDMSRLQEGADGMDLAPFDHSEMVLQTLLNFESRIDQKALEVDLDMPEEHLYALGHVDALTRVVYNILDNAVKFAREGGKLTIALWRQGGKLYTRIADEGQTIEPEELPRIFERFHKTDASRGLDRDGAGLGLYMVKAILDSHDQDIFVKSKDGETSFVFTLTESQPPAQLPSAHSDATEGDITRAL